MPQVSDDLTVRTVENHIVVDRPAKKVFDWVTTPKNMTRWFLLILGWDVYKGGPPDQPQKLGDSVTETVVPATPGGPVRVNRYTVVALTPGFQWTVHSQKILPDGTVSPHVGTIAVWTVQALPGNKSLFVRLFFSARSDETPWTYPNRKGTAQDPELIQTGLVHLKELVEQDLPSR